MASTDTEEPVKASMADRPSTRKFSINCDMGEGFGPWSMGPDEELMPLINTANIACGFHAGDPSTMLRTIRLAKTHGIAIGAHPGLPDLLGFGRRIIDISPSDLEAAVLYQVGALVAMLKSEDMVLNHIKPHGALFLMILKDEKLCEAVLRVNVLFGVPVIGMRGTLQEKVARRLGVEFLGEVFVDQWYGDEGGIIPLRLTTRIIVDDIPEKVRNVILHDTIKSYGGVEINLGTGEEDLSFTVHSDLPGSVETALAVRKGFQMAGIHSEDHL